MLAVERRRMCCGNKGSSRRSSKSFYRTPTMSGFMSRRGFKPIGVHEDTGFKVGHWHDIGYWRIGLVDGDAPADEPVPFAAFREAPAFAVTLGRRSS
jgi:hypothetical protein